MPKVSRLAKTIGSDFRNSRSPRLKLNTIMLCKPFALSQLAIPSVSLLISFLAYSSQYFLLSFEPEPLKKNELWILNGLILGIWICYYRSCTVDPGRIPKDWKAADCKQTQPGPRDLGRQRWCRKCEAFKPPRAHHCKLCGRLVCRYFSVKTGVE